MRPIRILRMSHNMLVLGFSLAVIALLAAVPAVVISYNNRKVVISELRTRVEGIASSVAVFIQKEAASYRRLSEAATAYDLSAGEHEYYTGMNSSLRLISERTGAAFIYTERWVDEDTVAYILDSTDPHSEDFSYLGDLDSMGPKEREAFSGLRTVSTELVFDPVWGRYISGFAPIINPGDGRVLGIVGVDYSAEFLERITTRMNVIVAVSFIFLIVFLTTGILILSALLSRIATEDYLTKLHNRRHLSRKLKEEILNARLSKRTFCLMLLDIDLFKQVNDLGGHEAGDRLLVAIALVIRSQTRAMDTCVRFGGDEFAILLPNCSMKRCHTVAERIQSAVSEIDALPGRKASVSIGMAQWEKGSNEQGLINNADRALYESKTQGRGVINIHQSGALD